MTLNINAMTRNSLERRSAMSEKYSGEYMVNGKKCACFWEMKDGKVVGTPRWYVISL